MPWEPMYDGSRGPVYQYYWYCTVCATESLGFGKPLEECSHPILEPPKPAGPIEMPTSNKYDTDKLPYHLLPTRPIVEILEVLQYGAKKHGDRNWENPGMAWSRLFSAAWRHLCWRWWGLGEDKDEESGLSHLAHAACCILFLMEYQYTHKALDDRPQRGG